MFATRIRVVSPDGQSPSRAALSWPCWLRPTGHQPVIRARRPTAHRMLHESPANGAGSACMRTRGVQILLEPDSTVNLARWTT
jgi:hypothetical protein